MFTGNFFDCDCDLLWMNRLAEETLSEQVSNALSKAQCVMNTTAGGSGSDISDGLDDFGELVRKTGFGSGGSGVSGVMGRGSNVHSNRKTNVDLEAEYLAGSISNDFEDDVQDLTYKSFDESQITSVSTLTEETCPGKEVPIVDGAPDAAQNSDRVLWENKISAAGSTLHRQSTPLTFIVLLPLHLALALAIQYFR